MSHASLAARYRPQTFAEVTGQDTVKAILSRSAAEDRVAPAYLLSGTRGVGKTTIARIFAKALNCEHAPTGEPCNQCEQCRRITQGNHVDVVEIDGASNRGIDDARRLREAISYAPMEGRYKVFIIDEAHMLTRESFNALLKTLEEPPARSTFILATTEVHKFPVTIVSRCQHFVFKAIPEAGLVEHLTRVLTRENIPFEENAVRLIARRAAGSVRDSMSLLGQTLALGGDQLTEAATRDVLGLAGQELYERLLHALKGQDCLAVAALTRELLDRGVDLGFFLRELAVLWRNLFLIRQAGPAAASALDMPEAEKARLLDLAPQFDPAYIHAAWQMVLESQRQVLGSLEPSAALELLLLNLAILPRLVSLETLSLSLPRTGATEEASPERKGSSAVAPATPPTRQPSPVPQAQQAQQFQQRQQIQPAQPAQPVQPVQQRGQEQIQAQPLSSPHPGARAASPRMPHPETRSPETPGEKAPRQPFPGQPPQMPNRTAPRPPARPQTPSGSEHRQASPAPQDEDSPPWDPAPVAGSRTVPEHDTGTREAPAHQEPVTQQTSDPQWQAFLEWCTDQADPSLLMLLRLLRGHFTEDRLILATSVGLQYEQFSAPERRSEVERLSRAFTGQTLTLEIQEPVNPRRTETDLKREMAEHPVIRALTEQFNASLVRCIPLEDLRTLQEQTKRKGKAKKAPQGDSK